MKKILTLLALTGLIASSAYSQNADSPKPIVIKATYFDISPPLRDIITNPNDKVDMSWKDGVVKNHHYPKGVKNDQADYMGVDPTLQRWMGKTAAPDVNQSFDGVGANNGVCPPDTDGDVGPNHYFHVTNLQYAIYNKTGTKLHGPANNSTIFTGLPNNHNDGDAVVLYDEAADRWLFSQFSLPNQNGPFYENVAISQTSDPTGSWYRYQFQFTEMPDYPKLSVWPDGYYMTTNRFLNLLGTYKGTGAIAMDREKMLAGDPTASMIFFTLSSSNEAWAVLPSDCDSEFPPVGTPAYFMYLKGSHIGVYEFHADWTTPENSTYSMVTSIPVSAYNGNISGGIPQLGTSVKLDAMSGRLMFRLPFRKFTDHWSIVCAGTINVGSGVAGIRWWELRKVGAGNWSVYQEGTYSPDDNSRWMGSISIDSSNNIALGYSISSATMYPSVRFTGRVSCDPLGQMTVAEGEIIGGGGSQTNTWTGNPSRWGDYSSMNTDPAAPCTFWYTQEYYAATSSASWKTRIGSFSFADILNIKATATPSTLCIGESTLLNANTYGGSGTYSYTWSSIPAGFSAFTKTVSVSPTVAARYIVHVNDGSISKSDTVDVNLIQNPSVVTENDTTYCWWVSAFPVTATVENASHVVWTTAGDGHFLIDTIVSSLYYPGSGDHSAGSVTLTLTANAIDPCTQTASDPMTIVFDPCTGIPAPNQDGFSVLMQPNPAVNNVTITVTGLNNEKVEVTISDIQGHLVYNQTFENSGLTLVKKIDLSSLPKGAYLVKVRSEKGIKTEKLIVQ
jgi:hypothetical protein